MNRVMKMFGIALLLCASAVSAMAEGGTVSFSDLHIDRSTFGIGSWSLTPGANGSLQIVAATVPASVRDLCRSRATLPSLTLESDGRRHLFRDVVFDKCPEEGSAGGTFTLTFKGQTTSPIQPATAWDRPNTTITGLRPAKIEGRLLSLKVRGNRATVVVAVPKTLSLPSSPRAAAPAASEIVITKLDGTSWSCSGAHVLYQDVTIPQSAQGSSRVIEIAIDFESMSGPRADYVDPESPLSRQ